MPVSASATFLSSLKARRTFYPLKPVSPIPDEKIVEIVKEVVLHTPTSFNSQTVRAVVHLGQSHKDVWAIVGESLIAKIGKERFDSDSKAKIDMFAGAYGTISFWTDNKSVEAVQAKAAPYADRFPYFASESLGMAQIATWTALELEGFGANLQHYNPLIDDGLRKKFDIPESWSLAAELVFGTPVAPAGEKDFAPIDERVKVFQ